MLFSCQDINQELRSLQVALTTVDDELKLHEQRRQRQTSNHVQSDENDNHVIDVSSSTTTVTNDERTTIDHTTIVGDRFVPTVDAFLCNATNDYADLNSLCVDMKRTVCRLITIDK